MKIGKKGFTLIEFLIALVVIGFIVGLLVNYFSNPLESAKVDKTATEISDKLNTFENAWLRWKIDGKDVSVNRWPDAAELADPAHGYLTSPIKVDGQMLFAYDRAVMVPDAEDVQAEVRLPVTPFNEKVCQKFNEKYAGMAADAPLVVPDTTKPYWQQPEFDKKNVFCYSQNGNLYDFIKVLEAKAN